MQIRNLFFKNNTSYIRAPQIGIVQKLIGKLFLALTGWKAVGDMPDIPKFILILAPHTSNWDLPFILAVMYSLGLKINWFGKRELFIFPFGCIFKWFGGIPIDRGTRQNMVQLTAQTIFLSEQMVVGIAPEGTRSKSHHWSTGFYYIAELACVPVVFGYLDYARKVGGLGSVMYITGNIERDMQVIRGFYTDITAKYPANVGEIAIR